MNTCLASFELLTDFEHVEMAANMVRTGVASIFPKNFFKAHKKYMEDFIVDEKSSFVLLIDANNLYAGVMEKLFLPVEDFGKIHFMN